MEIGTRVKPRALPDGSVRGGVVERVAYDGEGTMCRVRFDGVYFANVSVCVGGVNPASQYCEWFMAEELEHE